MLIYILLCLSQDKEATMPFVKLETLAINPITAEKYLYKEGLGAKLTQTFKECPVYMVFYKGRQEELVQIGTVNCVFKGGPDSKWMSASMKIKKDIPKDYVLRAKFVATESKQGKDAVLEVIDASITEFYLKPKEKASIFE
jgi:hypothetical protein